MVLLYARCYRAVSDIGLPSCLLYNIPLDRVQSPMWMEKPTWIDTECWEWEMPERLKAEYEAVS